MVFGVKTTLAHSGGGKLGHIVRNAGYCSMASLHVICQDCWQLVEVNPLGISSWRVRLKVEFARKTGKASLRRLGHYCQNLWQMNQASSPRRGRPAKDRPELPADGVATLVRELVAMHGSQQGLVDHIADILPPKRRRGLVPSRASIAAVLAGAPVSARFLAALCHACDRQFAERLLTAYARERLAEVAELYLPAIASGWDGAIDDIIVPPDSGKLGYSVCVPQADGKSVWRRKK